ncbi:MAG: hypothetical protein LC099_08020 [Anaerolineales bacterium]|nr:hypothetical protein [Anaerolineales bacterium]
MSNLKENLLRGASAALVGAVVSFALTQTLFSAEALDPLDRFFLIAVPACAVGAFIFYLLPFLEKNFLIAAPPVRAFLVLWAAGVAALIAFQFAPSALLFFPLFALALILVLPSAPAAQTVFEIGAARRIVGAWLFASLFSFLALGFLDDFYSSPLEIIFWILTLQALLGVGGYFLVGRLRRIADERQLDAPIYAALLLLLSGFALWLFRASQTVSLFPLDHFILNAATRGLFFFLAPLALTWQARLHLDLKLSGFYNRLKKTRLYNWVSANLNGLTLAFGFFVLYLIFAATLNHPRLDVDDIFFDADGLNYRLRLVGDDWRDFYWRSVHPYMILLFRPVIGLIALALKGDRLWGAYVFVALGGAACIYLAWTLIKSATGNALHASLVAALLGFSASHLIFGALLESYIFLAASLLLFFVLLIKGKPLPPLIAAAALTIGITYTNFAQNVIALFVVRPNLKKILQFVVSVVVLFVLLALLNNLLYPDSNPLFFIPSTLQAEQQNLFPLNRLRILALMRAFFFHNVLAPTPILYDKDIPFVQFRFFKPEINALSRYDLPIQNAAVWLWVALLILAGILFLLNLKKNLHWRISVALLGCIALNVGLHLRYGKELFLYSPNWTYAFILFLGLAWKPLAERRAFQILLLFFLALLVWNNGVFLQGVLRVLASQF